MRRLPTIAFLVACAVGVARAQPWHACLEYNSVYYDIVSDSSSTTMKRYNGAALIDSQPYSPFHLPAAGTTTWDEGVAFAATMQTRNAWLNTEQTSRATWEHSANSDVWTIYTTVNGVPNQFEFTTAKCRPASTTAAPTTTASPPATTGAPNCFSANNAFGIYCTAEEDCCGYGTMSPKCVAKNSGNQCCVHYKSATVCNATQSCCGMYGVGASSYAFCCNEGSSCCQASSSTQGATCCPSGTTCCRASSIGVCCAADEVCNPNMNSCTKVATSSTAPTPVPSVNRGCISSNGWFYDLRSDASGTTLDRYQGSTFVDRQTYAAFNRPAAGTTTWDEGVAFAAAMQTRNAWLNNEQTSAASWFEDASTGNDRFTFVTTVGGQPVQFVFATEACV